MNRGILYAAGAYAWWGLAPIYFKQMAAVPSLEIVLHRSIWSLLFLAIVLGIKRHWAWFGSALRQPRLLALFALSALMMSANWLIFVWAINQGRLIDAALGYFINPLFNVLLGVLVLHERLRRAQWLALSLAAGGVLWLTIQAGHLPWIALTLAGTFALYGLIRKTAPLGALEGLTMETFLLAFIAVPMLALLNLRGDAVATSSGPAMIGWLLLTGPVTAVPLLLFAAGARRVTLTTLGLLQYIGPTISFMLGIWLYHEPFDAMKLIGFVLIWSALAVYSAEGWWVGRQRGVVAAV